jgi:myb proto-oncogene protein
LKKHDFTEFSRILGVSESLLEFKWLKLAKPYIKNIPWEPAEDNLLEELMKTSSNKKWTELALKLFESGVSRILRTAKQVR